MRFIHTADLHLGAVPDRGMPWSEARAAALWNALRNMVRQAAEEKTDLLLIAGDMFHRQPTTGECRETAYLFGTIPQTRVVIIAGNHDYIRASSPYLSYPWPENVTILSSETMDSVWFPEINTEVHGFSYHRAEIRDALYDGVSAPSDDRIHILLAHGGDSAHIPIQLNRLASAGFDYIALGHIHQPRLFTNSAMAYCGSPEPLDRTDLGRRGYISGEIDDSGCHLKWVPGAAAEYRPIEIRVNRSSSTMQLADLLKERLDPDPRYYYRVTLVGFRDPETVFDLDAIQKVAQIADISDRSQPDYDLEFLAREHSHDLISHFIRALSKPDAGELQEKALAYGLQALLFPETGKEGRP